MTSALAVAAYSAALIVTYLVIGWLGRGVLVWKQEYTGCRTCALFGYIPLGPPYWLLRWHLRRTGRAMEREEELL